MRAQPQFGTAAQRYRQKMRHAARTIVFVAGFFLIAAACSTSTVEDSALAPTSSTVPTSTSETSALPSTSSTTVPTSKAQPNVDTDSDTQPAESSGVESTSKGLTDIPATEDPNEQNRSTPAPENPDDAALSLAPPTSDSGPRPDNSQETSMFGPIECRVGEENVQLTELMYETDLFDALVPMGRMWDSHVTPTDHLYFFLYEERERKMVRTPAAGRVIMIESFSRTQSPFWDPSIQDPDLRVVVAHSCTLLSIFIHVGNLAPDIANIVGEIEPGGRWHTGPDTAIELNAGDPIAVLGGSSFDYSLHDETKSLTGFQIPEHYEREAWKVHTVDPFDYMSDELAAVLLAKNVRQVEPYGGKIDYDVPGTLAGNWFMDGTVDYSGGPAAEADYWNGHLSVSYDHVDPSEIRISIGRDIGLAPDACRACGGVYAVMNNSPDPATIGAADGIVKYQLTGRIHSDPDNRERSASDGILLGIFLMQVIDDETIRTEFVLGAKAESAPGFSDDSVLYRR